MKDSGFFALVCSRGVNAGSGVLGRTRWADEVFAELGRLRLPGFHACSARGCLGGPRGVEKRMLRKKIQGQAYWTVSSLSWRKVSFHADRPVIVPLFLGNHFCLELFWAIFPSNHAFFVLIPVLDIGGSGDFCAGPIGM